jgi:hypothetical protein
MEIGHKHGGTFDQQQGVIGSGAVNIEKVASDRVLNANLWDGKAAIVGGAPAQTVAVVSDSGHPARDGYHDM